VHIKEEENSLGEALIMGKPNKAVRVGVCQSSWGLRGKLPQKQRLTAAGNYSLQLTRLAILS